MVIMLLLAACGRDAKETVGADVYPVTDAEPKVTVSRFVNFGIVNKEAFGTFDNAEYIKDFEDAIETAEQITGELNVVDADYDVIIERSGVPKAIYLWIDHAASDGTQGMFMYADNSGIGYSLTNEATKKLYDLIRSIEE